MKVVGVILFVIAFVLFYNWLAMLAFGAVAGWFGLYSLGFGQTIVVLAAVGFVGRAWNTPLYNGKAKK